MNGLEKSDLPIVAGKLANGAALAAKESVERRGGTRENVDLQNTVRTQSREAVSRAQARIREALTRNKTERLTTLLHHITLDVLRAGFFSLKKTAAPGIDGMTWVHYAEELEANLRTSMPACTEERIERLPLADNTFRRRMAGNDRSALPHWRTKSSRRRWWRS